MRGQKPISHQKREFHLRPKGSAIHSVILGFELAADHRREMTTEVIRPDHQTKQALNEVEIQIANCKQPANKPKHPGSGMLCDVDFTFHFLPQETSKM